MWLLSLGRKQEVLQLPLESLGMCTPEKARHNLRDPTNLRWPCYEEAQAIYMEMLRKEMPGHPWALPANPAQMPDKWEKKPPWTSSSFKPSSDSSLSCSPIATTWRLQVGTAHLSHSTHGTMIDSWNWLFKPLGLAIFWYDEIDNWNNIFSVNS